MGLTFGLRSTNHGHLIWTQNSRVPHIRPQFVETRYETFVRCFLIAPLLQSDHYPKTAELHSPNHKKTLACVRIANHLESQVAQSNEPLYHNLAHYSLKVGHGQSPLVFHVGPILGRLQGPEDAHRVESYLHRLRNIGVIFKYQL